MKITKNFTTYRGVVYFADFETARAFGERYARDWPERRVVEYGRGYAIQLYRGGSYLGPDGRPDDHEA